MITNYALKSSFETILSLGKMSNGQKPKSNGFVAVVLMLLFSITEMQAQTQLIPTADGGFETGSTFAANGWTVANEGAGVVKWVLGTAVNSGAITEEEVQMTGLTLDEIRTRSFYRILQGRRK